MNSNLAFNGMTKVGVPTVKGVSGIVNERARLKNALAMRREENIGCVITSVASLGDICVRAWVEDKKLKNGREVMKINAKKAIAEMKAGTINFRENEVTKRQLMQCLKELALEGADAETMAAVVKTMNMYGKGE